MAIVASTKLTVAKRHQTSLSGRQALQLLGVKELVEELEALNVRLQNKIMGEALEAASHLIAYAASERAPRADEVSHPDVGHLADNITFNIKKGKLDVTSVVGPRKEAFWGFFQEFGWTGIVNGTEREFKRQPFMRPAFDQEKRAALGIIIDKIREGIERNR